MIRKSVFAIAFILVVSLGTWPERSEAANLTMLCWNGAPHGTIEAPIPTVGCSFSWAPGGLTAMYANFLGSYPTCSPNCVVTPGEWAEPFINVNNPLFGNRTDQLDFNCVGQIVTVSVIGVVVSYKVARSDPIEVDSADDNFVGGIAGIWCP